MDVNGLLKHLGTQIVNSPYLSVMIVNRKYQIVWHNQRFADEFNGGKPIENKFCYQSSGSAAAHDGCPAQKSIQTGKTISGYMDFGDRNFFFITVPLDGELAAEVHVSLTKEADNAVSEK